MERKQNKYRGYRDLKAYQLALDIHELTKDFPKEEKYSLVDQIRRSSRSVAANLAKACKKRRYEKAFISKLVDCAGEAGETEVWLDFSKDFAYLDELFVLNRQIAKKSATIGLESNTIRPRWLPQVDRSKRNNHTYSE